MKTSKILFLIASLLIPASLYAAEQKFLNVGGINLSNDKIVTLDSYSCTEGKGLSQWPLDYKNSGLVCEVSRPASTPSELHSSLKEIIQNYWGHSLISILGSLSKKPKLTLQSDIDLGQYDPSDTDNEKCIFNHEPLSFPEEADIVFDGNGHKIMNLCYVENVNDKATAPAGFFGQIKSGTVKNVVFRNARVIVNPPKKGEAQVSADKYHPVGVLAGVVKNATLDGITLMDVDVRGPVAGGLAGYIENSTVKKIDAQDDIFVTNETDVDVTGGAFAGESEIGWGAGYSVFLGGLAAATYQTDFDDVSIRAHVQESSNNSSSALGGLVGLYTYAGNKSGSSGKNAFIRNIRLTVNDEKKAFMKIAGGSTMGGLVGFASLYDYKYGTTYDLNISDVKVDSVQIGTSCGSEVYVGGLVGKGNVVAGSALKIQNSSANVNLKDELTVAQSYAYYVGGFVGFASNSISNISGGVDRFLSIQNSTVMGNIKVGANASVANKAGFSPKAYLGGFVGWAMFSADGNALAKDESGVNIVSTLEGTSGTVFAGGMVGFSNIFSNENLKLHDLQFKGTLNIVHSGDSTLVGGIVGGFPDGDGGRSISFKDITLEAPESNLINVNVHEGASAKGVLDVGGVCGYAKGVADLDKVSLKGDVTVQGKGTLDSVIVGGLIGNIFQSPAPGLNLFGTYSIGNISVADDVKAEFKKMGYMAGYVLIYALEEVQSNYHFGSSDLDVEGFGMFSTGAAIDWKNDARFSFNVRNGSANELVGLQNGTMMDVNMKKKEFAGFLNEAWDKEADYVWSFKVNSHEDLPFFAKGVDKPEKPSTTKYTVKFVNFDDQLVGKEQRVKFGSKPTIPPAPTRASTVQYDYQFKEWNPVVSTVFTDMTYKAVYEPMVRSYTVTFKDFDDKQIGAVQKVEYDAMPTVPADPTRASTAQYDYKFKGWDKAIVKVTGDATYKAVYEPMVRSYTVTFKDYDDKQIGTTQTLKYGTKPTAPTAPTRASTAQYDYKFKGWAPAIANVTGTATYKATYDSTVRSYTVTFVDYDGKQIGTTQTLKYGTKPTAPTAPTRASTAQYDYKFKGWDKTIANVTGSATYKATYDSTVRSYTVTFVDYDGKQISKQTVVYGSTAKAPANPTRSGYNFTGWDVSFDKVVGNMTVSAKYEAKVTPKSSSSAKVSSSSEAKSSSSAKVSSSSEAKSSSSAKVSSSSKAKSSSSVKASSSSKAKSSSSASNKVLPYIVQSGNAIRVGFGTGLYDCNMKNEVSVRIVGEKGVYIDTLITDSLTTKLPEMQWVLAPAPVGEYQVIVKVKNALEEVRDTMTFKVDDRITVVPHVWQMVSLNMMNIDSLKKMNKEDAAFYWWDENNPMGDYWQYRKFSAGDEVVSGRGYWYGSTVGVPLVIKQESPVKGTEIVWKMDSLYSGWNLIANPHGWYVDLTKGTGGKVEFWRWNAETGEYEIPTNLGPYEAVWAKVHKKTEFRVPVNPVFSLVRDSSDFPVLKKSAENEDWSLRVSLTDGFGKRDSWNVLAAGDGESLEEPPAGMGDHVNLSILDGSRRLAKSVKSRSNEFVWNLEASATSARNGYITFDGVEKLLAMGQHVYVDVDGVTTDVKNSEPVKLRLSSNVKKVTVRVSGKLDIAHVAGMKLFRVEQLPQSMKVNFDVPENLAGAQVKVNLVTVNGEVLASAKTVASSGSNGISLVKPEFGVYFVQVQVGSQTNSARILVK